MQCWLTSWMVALNATIAVLPSCRASSSGLDSISWPWAGLPFLMWIAAQSRFVSNLCIMFTTLFPKVTQSFRSFSVILMCAISSMWACTCSEKSSAALCMNSEVLRKPTKTTRLVIPKSWPKKKESEGLPFLKKKKQIVASEPLWLVLYLSRCFYFVETCLTQQRIIPGQIFF